MAEKKVIYIVGRQHAAETSSSHMLEGLINFLISDEPYAYGLRNHYVWYIVPMANPDGVYLGNSRATSELRDPNRDWYATNIKTSKPTSLEPMRIPSKPLPASTCLSTGTARWTTPAGIILLMPRAATRSSPFYPTGRILTARTRAEPAAHRPRVPSEGMPP